MRRWCLISWDATESWKAFVSVARAFRTAFCSRNSSSVTSYLRQMSFRRVSWMARRPARKWFALVLIMTYHSVYLVLFCTTAYWIGDYTFSQSLLTCRLLRAVSTSVHIESFSIFWYCTNSSNIMLIFSVIQSFMDLHSEPGFVEKCR